MACLLQPFFKVFFWAIGDDSRYLGAKQFSWLLETWTRLVTKLKVYILLLINLCNSYTQLFQLTQHFSVSLAFTLPACEEFGTAVIKV
jgi:hypothetical protein